MQTHEMTKNTLSFLRTELDVAMTFVVIARQAKYRDRVVRNAANARKACKALRYFMDRVFLSEEEAAEIGGRLEKVENELAKLDGGFLPQNPIA